jgi:biofilm PGA synthesis N-glycosyltransferase PgaC
MDAWRFTFWLLLGILFYTYIGYALLLLLLNAFRRQRALPPADLPAVTVVIASYNEASGLAAKLANTHALNYPAGKLSVIVITDGSTDDSAAIIARHPATIHLHEPARQGKTAALNRALAQVSSPIVIFSDANTLLNPDALRFLVAPFADARVGAVAGEKKVASQAGMGSAEGWYWQYESVLKHLDASFHTVVGAAGELFALRRSLFTPLPADTILDDLMLSLQVCLSGHTIAYEPRAFATEPPSLSLRDEAVRKKRIAAGAFQALKRLSWSSLAKQPVLLFQFVSRRWLRWVICPPALLLLIPVHLLLLFTGAPVLYTVLFVLHVAFYAAAALGWWLMRRGTSFGPATVPFYFLFMNACMIAGALTFRRGKATVLWEKASRPGTDP